MTFFIKEKDTSPAIKYQLQDHNGDPVNLQGVQKLRFHMKKENSAQPEVLADKDQGVSIPDAQNGIVKYEWKQRDTESPGEYNAEFQVTFSGGKTESFPNRRDITVRVEEEVA